MNAALEPAVANLATWVNLYPLFLNEAGTAMEDSITNDGVHLLGQGYLICVMRFHTASMHAMTEERLVTAFPSSIPI